MKRRTWCMLVLASLLPCLIVACSNNGCEDALDQTSKLTHEICAGDTAYGATPFCQICVRAGYLSTTGPTDCRCSLLAYDQGVCSTPSDEEAKSAIREAIKWANESCRTFTLTSTDGGAGQGGGDSQGGAAGN